MSCEEAISAEASGGSNLDVSMRLVPTERFSWEPLPDGCLLYEESTGLLLTLNHTAELILSHCDGDHSMKDLCALVEAELEIVPSVTLQTLLQLIESGVVEKIAE